MSLLDKLTNLKNNDKAPPKDNRPIGLQKEPLCWGRQCKDAEAVDVYGLNHRPVICRQAPLPGSGAEIISLVECPRHRWKMFAPKSGNAVGAIVTNWGDKGS